MLLAIIYISKKTSINCTFINQHPNQFPPTSTQLYNTPISPSYKHMYRQAIPHVDILDDEEQNRYYQNLVELQRNSEILKQAMMSRTSIDLVFSVAMSKIKGERSHKQQLVKNQIINYFHKHCHIDLKTQYFTPRIQPQYDQHTTTLANTIIVYGVDFLSYQQVIQMFTIPHHPLNLTIQNINWINDSHVQLTFFSEDITLEVINRTSSKTQGYKIKAEQEHSQLPKGWFELNSYEIYRIQRKMYARFATSKQIGIKLPKTVSRHKIFQNAASTDLQVFLLTKYSAKQQYQQMLFKIQHEENNKKVFSKSKYRALHKGIHKQSMSASDRKFQQYIEKGKELAKMKKPSNPNISMIHKAKSSNKLAIDQEQQQQDSSQQFFDVDQQQINPNLDWSYVQRYQQNIESKQHILQDIHMMQIMQLNQPQKQENLLISSQILREHSEISSAEQKNHLINQFNHLHLDNLSIASSSENVSLQGRNILQYLSLDSGNPQMKITMIDLE